MVATLPLVWLDTLWVQVAGTVCNIACRHCFVSAGPKNERHRLMSVADVVATLDEGLSHGVREVWYTGGEPFVHPDILRLVEVALERAPLGVLTNGMRIDRDAARSLARLADGSAYNLEIRVSLDGPDAATNDAIRGPGTFAAACEGIRSLSEAGLEPIVAVTQLEDGPSQGFLELLRDLGLQRPRLKWIPTFRVGREVLRSGPPDALDRVTVEQAADPEAPHRVQCGTSRTVTSQGVFPCPILVDEPGARIGATLGEALRPHRVDHPACATCWATGFSCSR
jgi:MoaA/NifB/PqqE/SkfB family radical SAM enzyme